MNRFIVVLLGVLLAPQETAHLKIATSTSTAAVAPGKSVALWLDVVPKPKMHVYAPGQAGYITIALTLDSDPAYTAAKPAYPPAEKIVIEALNETQRVYTKPFRVAEEITIAATPEMRRRATDGTPLTIKGSVRYQACDETICYLPATVPVEWTVTLATTPARRGSGS